MEEEIYFDDFELTVQEQANRFKMVPAKKVWHGIYNDLHPGRRWPSVMVSLVLIFSIVFIGNINTQVDKKSAHIHLPTPGGIHDGKDLPRPEIINGNNQLSVKPVYQKDDKQNQVVQSNAGKTNTLFNRNGGNTSSIDLSVLPHQKNKISTVNSKNTFAWNQPHSPIEASLESNSGNKSENNSQKGDVNIENPIADNELDIITTVLVFP